MGWFKMPSEDEIFAIERALARILHAKVEELRKEAIDVACVAERARRPVDQATQIPPAQGEHEICRCPILTVSTGSRPNGGSQFVHVLEADDRARDAGFRADLIVCFGDVLGEVADPSRSPATRIPINSRRSTATG